MSDLPIYQLDRVFKAPPVLVWRTFTEAEFLARWYGPGVETIIHQLSVEEGGVWLDEMRMNGKSFFERIEYTKVVPQQRLVWLQTITDDNWQVSDNPMMPDWPKTMKACIDFVEMGAETKLCFTWSPHEASQEEVACFTAAVEGMGKGWGSGFDIIETILAELQAG